MTYFYRQDGILLRPLVREDAESLVRAVRESMASLSYWFPWCHAGYALSDARQWIEHGLASWETRTEFPLGIFDAGGEVLGGTGINHIDRVHNLGNLGYWVRDSARKRGVATTAARGAALMGFDVVGLTRLEIVALPHNAASQRVAEKLGAVREAEARNRVQFQGRPAAAVVYSLIPGDLRGG